MTLMSDYLTVYIQLPDRDLSKEGKDSKESQNTWLRHHKPGLATRGQKDEGRPPEQS